jgi:hypothetical protein
MVFDSRIPFRGFFYVFLCLWFFSLNIASAARGVPIWSEACAEIISSANVSQGLVDGFGNPLSSINGNDTFGITRDTCYEYCSTSTIYQVASPSALRTSSKNLFWCRLVLLFQLFCKRLLELALALACSHCTIAIRDRQILEGSHMHLCFFGESCNNRLLPHDNSSQSTLDSRQI